MKPSLAANVALVTVVIGWASGSYGVLSQLGDPAPWVPKAELAAHRDVSLTFMFSGALLLLASLWLSGYAFSNARVRASIATLLVVVPLIIILSQAFPSA